MGNNKGGVLVLGSGEILEQDMGWCLGVKGAGDLAEPSRGALVESNRGAEKQRRSWGREAGG